MPSPARGRAHSAGRLDGLNVRIAAGPALSDVEFGRALRMLARMMVRGQRDAGDHTAISPDSRSSSALTVVHHTSPDHHNNEAA